MSKLYLLRFGVQSVSITINELGKQREFHPPFFTDSCAAFSDVSAPQEPRGHI